MSLAILLALEGYFFFVGLYFHVSRRETAPQKGKTYFFYSTFLFFKAVAPGDTATAGEAGTRAVRCVTTLKKLELVFFSLLSQER